MGINLDKRNYRKHNDKNKKLINKSLKECGAGRSIVIDNEDNIIAGNGIYEQAQKLGLKTKVIELAVDPQLMGALGAAEFARKKGGF